MIIYLYRKFLHLLFGIFVVLLIRFDIYPVEILLSLFIIEIIFSILSMKHKIPVISFFIDNLSKKGEYPGWGLIMFNLSSILVYSIFNRTIAIAAISVLTIGDSISSIIGIEFGQIKLFYNKKKDLEGRLVAIFICTFILSFAFPMWISFVASFFGILIESIDINLYKMRIDDNLLIPFASAIVLFLFQFLL